MDREDGDDLSTGRRLLYSALAGLVLVTTGELVHQAWRSSSLSIESRVEKFLLGSVVFFAFATYYRSRVASREVLKGRQPAVSQAVDEIPSALLSLDYRPIGWGIAFFGLGLARMLTWPEPGPKGLVLGPIGVMMTLVGIHLAWRGNRRTIEVDPAGIRLGGRVDGHARETIPWDDVERCELVAFEVCRHPDRKHMSQIRIVRATDEVFGLPSRVVDLKGVGDREALLTVLRERLMLDKVVIPG